MMILRVLTAVQLSPFPVRTCIGIPRPSARVVYDITYDAASDGTRYGFKVLSFKQDDLGGIED